MRCCYLTNLTNQSISLRKLNINDDNNDKNDNDNNYDNNYDNDDNDDDDNDYNDDDNNVTIEVVNFT